MPRISIALPKRFGFSTDLQIYQSHINEAGHLDNVQLLSLVSEARQRFFLSLDYTQTCVDGVGIVVADAAIQYLSEAFHGETLSFEMAAEEFSKYGCDLVYRVRDKASGREVARGKTGIVFFDYQARRVAPVPARFREKTDPLHESGR
jgi:4-hydroxybenzoyl-CoA thioesterase